jgi:hypothetical protein
MSEARAPNVLFFGFRRPLNQQALRQALAESNVGRVGLVARSNCLGDRADYFLSAKHGLRACTFDSYPFKAFPSAAFLRGQQPSEVVVLRMFDRIYRKLSAGQSYEIRKRLYLEQLTWVYGIIQDLEFDMLILSDIPHTPFAYILYSVAKALGKDVFFLMQIPIKDTFIISRSVEDMFTPVRAEYRKLKISGELPALSARLQKEFDRRSGKQHRPFYMSRRDLPWTRRVADWAKWTFRVDTNLRVHRSLRNGIAYWRACKSMPAEGTPYVYFPLHLQPEATTLPMGDIFVDQYMAVEMLARALPRGWVVVLKEHPAQRMAKRDYRFYSRLGRIANVHLVSRDEDTFTLTGNSRAVASITGTPGWEAIFAGKPVIVFGNAYYRGAPGTISVNDPDDLAASLDEIDRGAFPLRETEDILRYLAAIDRCSYEGIVDKVFLRDSDLPEQQSIENYTAILKRLIASPGSFDNNG